MDTEPIRARKERRQAVEIRRTVRLLPDWENMEHLEQRNKVGKLLAYSLQR